MAFLTFSNSRLIPAREIREEISHLLAEKQHILTQAIKKIIPIEIRTFKFCEIICFDIKFYGFLNFCIFAGTLFVDLKFVGVFTLQSFSITFQFHGSTD